MGATKKHAAVATEQPTTPKGDYNAVVACCQLRSVRLLASTFTVKPAFIEQRDRVVLNFGGEAIGIEYDEALGVASGQFAWHVSATVDGQEVVSLTATYQVIYDGVRDCDQTAVNAFVDRVGAFAVFPYLRAHVAQTAWEADLDIPPLPVLKAG